MLLLPEGQTGETFQKEMLSRKSGEHWIEKYFHFFSVQSINLVIRSSVI
jgi:hypothetical protein